MINAHTHPLKISKRIVLVICGVLIGSLYGCRNEISEIKAITDPQRLPVQTNLNSSYLLTEKGKIRNKLTAVKLDRYSGENDYLEASEGFTVIFYDTLEREEARLQAVHGIYQEKEKRLTAREKVELFNLRGDKLETEEIVFLLDSARIFTDKFVTITTESGVIYGKGLESNESFTRYRIIKPYGDLFMKEDKESKIHDGKNN